MGHPQVQGIGSATEEKPKRRGTEVSDRKNPPFAEKREGWDTLKFRGLVAQRKRNPRKQRGRFAASGCKNPPFPPEAGEGWGTLKFRGWAV